MIFFMLMQPVPVVVYPFKHRRDWDGKWIPARYMAVLDEIAAMYSGDTHDHGGSFSPWQALSNVSKGVSR